MLILHEDKRMDLATSSSLRAEHSSATTNATMAATMATVVMVATRTIVEDPPPEMLTSLAMQIIVPVADASSPIAPLCHRCQLLKLLRANKMTNLKKHCNLDNKEITPKRNKPTILFELKLNEMSQSRETKVIHTLDRY